MKNTLNSWENDLFALQLILCTYSSLVYIKFLGPLLWIEVVFLLFLVFYKLIVGTLKYKNKDSKRTKGAIEISCKNQGAKALSFATKQWQVPPFSNSGESCFYQFSSCFNIWFSDFLKNCSLVVLGCNIFYFILLEIVGGKICIALHASLCIIGCIFFVIYLRLHPKNLIR